MNLNEEIGRIKGIIKKLTINELDFKTDNTYPYEYTGNQSDNEYIFNTKNRQYSVFFIRHRDGSGVYERSFKPTATKEELKKYGENSFFKYLTPQTPVNDFDVLKTYSTVTKITEDFINNNMDKVNVLYIHPIDSRRKNLVGSFINKLTLPSNYFIIENFEGDFFIVDEGFFEVLKYGKQKRRKKEIDPKKLKIKDFYL
jgi:hypothetical protein